MLETWVHRVILQKYQSLQNKHMTTFYKKASNCSTSEKMSS